jgi:glutamate/tyrosine decarboxylase-like PLP-dependent enzyme
MTLEWPAVVLIMFVILAIGVALGGPTRRRHALELAEIKAKGNEGYQALAERCEALAKETRDAQTAMQSDLATVRVSVQTIETMMRDVS